MVFCTNFAFSAKLAFFALLGSSKFWLGSSLKLKKIIIILVKAPSCEQFVRCSRIVAAW